MRSFFQTRRQEQPQVPVRANRPASQGTAFAHCGTRDDLDEGVTVSELSELEARALCAREGISFFWPQRAPVRGETY